MKAPVDYLGKKFFPAYGGQWAGEFPHMLVNDKKWNRVIQRIYFAPDNFEMAWENVCAICDLMNAEYDKAQKGEHLNNA